MADASNSAGGARVKLTAHEQLFLQSLCAALLMPFSNPNRVLNMSIAVAALPSVDDAHPRLGPLFSALAALMTYGVKDDPLMHDPGKGEDHNMTLLDLKQKLADVMMWRAGLVQAHINAAQADQHRTPAA